MSHRLNLVLVWFVTQNQLRVLTEQLHLLLVSPNVSLMVRVTLHVNLSSKLLYHSLAVPKHESSTATGPHPLCNKQALDAAVDAKVNGMYPQLSPGDIMIPPATLRREFKKEKARRARGDDENAYLQLFHRARK